MEIVLLRHGEPEIDLLALSEVKVAANELKALVQSYVSAGIKEGQYLPEAAIEIALKCNAVVCSDLPRSIDSAKALGVEDIYLSESMFREMAIPYANWKSPKLSLRAWYLLFRLFWLLGYSTNGESIRLARKRVTAASGKLRDIAKQRNSVLLVGHAIVNRFIAKELVATGWDGPKTPGEGYWEFAVYRS